MNIFIINTGIFLIALLHVWFFILEMFLWQKPIGLKTFRIHPEFAKQSASLAANQGLYNLFLSVGLFWGLASHFLHLKIFFLSCIAIAGLYAGLSVNRKILWVQALPAIIILGLLIA
jgi:putative membrane protein